MGFIQQQLQESLIHLQARLDAQETANKLQEARFEAQEALFKTQQEQIESATLAQQTRLGQQDQVIQHLQITQNHKSSKGKNDPTSPVVSVSCMIVYNALSLTRLQAFIHKIMLHLLGVVPLRKGKLPALPHALVDGEPHRIAAEGTELHNPDWTVGLLAPASQAFIEMTAALALQQEQV